MVGLDVDALFLGRRNSLFALDGFDHPGDGSPREAQEEDLLTGSKVMLGELRRLNDGNGRLTRSRPPRDKEVPVGIHHLKLLFS